MDLKIKIDQYCSYFKDQLGKIVTIDGRLHQKILLVVIFDTWARARYPNEKTNRKRFVSLIREYSGWSESERVSLPQLCLLLEELAKKEPTEPPKEPTALMKEVRYMLSRWEYGKIHRLGKDPVAADLEGHVADDNEWKIIHSSRHAELFYTYRNHLIHEFREPGYGMEFSDDGTTPYYHGMANDNGTWELVYPIGFLVNTAETLITNLTVYFMANNLDPFSSYDFGSLWTRKGARSVSGM